ncbi:MAG: bifunctional DNA-formamidopyrimidine glycosylase/DNA-(apurinic or apyrimidinic site) lyase [Kineosporiaceae bacterium]|nr:bifunctional DNA-formamidopyrimidine glycosylase/DNA-(apurinic or apyrimidinic site) lyase [Kineosporiaceae bacterium]
MPELPEVEVVRRGLARWVVGTTIEAVEVRHPRPVRAHLAGPRDFADRLTGETVHDVVRRGKFSWLVLDTGALLVHLGMSGQLVLQPPEAPAEPHLRVRFSLGGGSPARAGRELRFVDQRMFGGLTPTTLVPTSDGLPAGVGEAATGEWVAMLPPQVSHIARDALDPHLDVEALVRRLRTRRTAVKRAILDQGLVSGIGNIYADEALWRARLHYDRPLQDISLAKLRELIGHARDVMTEALAVGGTSFDALYVNVNGESGYFERGLAAYGREGLPCARCGTPLRRERFTNRSSFRCPRCQRR